MEIEVNGEIYQLVAGFGFLHEVNKKLAVDVKSAGTKKRNWIEIHGCKHH
jgi:hypothetical protein